MTAAATLEPARSFVSREPQLALRLLLSRDAAIHRVVADEIAAVIAEVRPQEDQPLGEHIHTLVLAATSLVWATFMIGDQPQIDNAVDLIRMVLAASRAKP
jgi:hypothetical protein